MTAGAVGVAYHTLATNSTITVDKSKPMPFLMVSDTSGATEGTLSSSRRYGQAFGMSPGLAVPNGSLDERRATMAKLHAAAVAHADESICRKDLIGQIR